MYNYRKHGTNEPTVTLRVVKHSHLQHANMTHQCDVRLLSTGSCFPDAAAGVTGSLDVIK